MEIKEAVVAGSFYPQEEKRLRAEINSYLDSAKEIKKTGKVFGFISPHAGYIYSGPVAAYAYRQIMDEKYSGVVILAPSHFIPKHGVSFIDKDFYQTPLGLVPIDRERIKKLKGKKKWLEDDPSLYLQEHSLEVQIPFLQVALKNFMLLPLFIGTNDYEICRDLAGLLYDSFKNENLLYIASSDLSHYHSYANAQEKDAETIEVIQQMDASLLSERNIMEEVELCGIGPVITLLELFKKIGGKNNQLWKYANSGDTAGMKDRVVGYASIGFTK